MKKFFVLIASAALLAGCNENTGSGGGESGTGSDTTSGSRNTYDRSPEGAGVSNTNSRTWGTGVGTPSELTNSQGASDIPTGLQTGKAAASTNSQTYPDGGTVTDTNSATGLDSGSSAPQKP